MDASKNIAHTLLSMLEDGRTGEQVTKDFMKFVTSHKMENRLPDILRHLERLVEMKSRNEQVRIRTPFEISKNTVSGITEKMNASGKDVEVEIDETLIGGFIATYKGLEYDASLKKQLVLLQESLTH